MNQLNDLEHKLRQVPDPVALLEALFTHLPVGLQIFLPTGQSLMVNEAFVRIFGATPPPEYNVLRDEIAERSGYRQAIQRVLAGEIVHFPCIWYDPRELEHVRVAEGRRAAVEATALPLRDSAGKVAYIAMVFNELTEQIAARDEAHAKQLQAEARAAELEAIIHSIPDAVFIGGPQGITRVNQAALDMLGVESIDELTGNLAELGVRLRPRDPETGAPVPDSEQTFRLAELGESLVHDVLVRHAKSGQDHVVRAAAAPIRVEGRVTGAVVIHTDVTERRRSAQQRAEALARTEALTQSWRFLADATAVLSSSLDHQQSLQALADLAVPRLGDWCVIELLDREGALEPLAIASGDAKQVALAREWRRRYPPSPQSRAGAMAVIRTGRSELYREITDEVLARSHDSDDARRILRQLGLRSAIIVPLKVHGAPIGAVSLLATASRPPYDESDLTLLEELAYRAGLAIENARLYREAQLAIQRRDELFSMAAHELKTPLASLELHIAGLLRLLERGEVPSRERLIGKLQRTRVQVGRLTSLIHELLDVSRAVSGRLPIERRDVDLGELTGAVLGRFQEAAAAAGCELRAALQPGVIGQWDPDRLDQVLTNLLTNAIKYGPGRPIEVSVERRGGGAGLRVRDHGVGIHPRDHARIFERFERATSTRHYGGVGIGLWIVREIVRAHGGNISVDSAPGQGATFEVQLPTSVEVVAEPATMH